MTDQTDAATLTTAIEAVGVHARAGLEAASTTAEVEDVRAAAVGRHGELTRILRALASVEPEARPRIGAAANALRVELERAIANRLAQLRRGETAGRLAAEAIDMTAPGRPVAIGHLHPTMIVERDLREVLHGFGFELFEGPEIETDEMNFEALNIPPDHPSRDLWDTIYVAERESDGALRPAEDGTILRTHTSPVQIRAMRALEPPIRVLMPGRCFRYEAVDASHGFEFFQVEGLVVDRDTSMADLKGTLEEVARALYGDGTRTRFRPGYYPFTEPSVAFDVACLVCGGSGCAACGRTGWMTILGAGMVHPRVLRAGGIDPDEYQGYAFGMGLDRLTMLRYGVDDLRQLMSADLRFLEQLSEGR